MKAPTKPVEPVTKTASGVLAAYLDTLLNWKVGSRTPLRIAAMLTYEATDAVVPGVSTSASDALDDVPLTISPSIRDNKNSLSDFRFE
ncbi:hypothetical protein RRF57_000352 [Xylaria bambusicola]|uniref:Uncharacterized protein n=1 Tax=Xylaria bambusicola TaxID=326684 RepID=A0AAN7Z5I5_9PEZI